METTTETTVRPKIEDQLGEFLKVNFGCHVKYDGLDPETPTSVKVNIKDELSSEELEELLLFKDLHAFDKMTIKRSGGGLCISFFNESNEA